jgi:sucrose phosphorylase
MLAGENDIELLEETKVGRNINRHYYSKAEIESEVQRPVVQKLIKLMEFRNSYPAFAGDYTIHDSEREEELKISWQNGEARTVLKADFSQDSFEIEYYDQQKGVMETLEL